MSLNEQTQLTRTGTATVHVPVVVALVAAGAHGGRGRRAAADQIRVARRLIGAALGTFRLCGDVGAEGRTGRVREEVVVVSLAATVRELLAVARGRIEEPAVDVVEAGTGLLWLTADRL